MAATSRSVFSDVLLLFGLDVEDQEFIRLTMERLR
jgi:hypothetical protein